MSNRWTFYFAQEGNVVTETKKEEEDGEILNWLTGGKEVIRLPGNAMEIFVHRSHVKCATRQHIDIPQPPMQGNGSDSPQPVEA